MEEKITAPIYAQIALDIASRIQKGELRINEKIHGRSILASQYGVSPETIRRAVKLLEDMQVVEVQQNSGVKILSAENAARYVLKFSEQADIRSHQKALRSLLAEHDRMMRRIADEAEAILRIQEKFSVSNPFNPYEVDVPADSPLLGKTLNELKFWQETAATIIAIRRNGQIILSPGPYAPLLAGDTLVFIGELRTLEVVQRFLAGA